MASSTERSEMNATNQQTNSSSDYKPAQYQGRPPRNQRSLETGDKNSRSETVLNDKEKSQKKEETEATEETKPLSLAELFSDESEDETSSDTNSDSGPVDSIDKLSKRLGMKPEQVYAIKVPMPNGAESLTIGELKDRVGELVDLETRELQFDLRRRKAEGEILRAQQDMREILSMIPKETMSQIQPLLEKSRKRHEATVNRERQLTLEHIPAWQDEEIRQRDISGMIEMLEDYGFDESFITTVVDHRAMKFIHDAYLTQKKIKAALSKVTIPNKKGKRPSEKPSKAPAKPHVSSNSSRILGQPDQRSRIVELFNSLES